MHLLILAGHAMDMYILRDSVGQVLLLGAGPLLGCVSMEHAKLLAIRHSLNQIGEHCDKFIIIETDCLNLIRQLQHSEINLCVLGDWLKKSELNFVVWAISK